jgi:hypothetical protein
MLAVHLPAAHTARVGITHAMAGHAIVEHAGGLQYAGTVRASTDKQLSAATSWVE